MEKKNHNKRLFPQQEDDAFFAVAFVHNFIILRILYLGHDHHIPC